MIFSRSLLPTPPSGHPSQKGIFFGRFATTSPKEKSSPLGRGGALPAGRQESGGVGKFIRTKYYFKKIPVKY